MTGEVKTSDDGVADFGKWLIWFGIWAPFVLRQLLPKVLHPTAARYTQM
jgi:hypothetical protein